MTITNVLELDGTPMQGTDIWYTVPIADSSFVESVLMKNNGNGSVDVKYVLGSGEYVYTVDRPYAETLWVELAEGESPGGMYADLREYVRNNRFVPAPPAPQVPAPEATWAIRVSGPATKIDALVHHLRAAGFSVE